MFKSVGSLIGGQQIKRARSPILAIQIRQVSGQVIADELRSFGADVVASVKVKTYKGGVLTVCAPSAVLAELHMRSVDLVVDINKKFGEKIIKKLNLRGV